MLQIIFGSLSYTQQHVYINPNLLIYPSSHLFVPFGNQQKVSFYVCESTSVLEITSFASFFFLLLDSTYVIIYDFVLLCLVCLT